MKTLTLFGSFFGVFCGLCSTAMLAARITTNTNTHGAADTFVAIGLMAYTALMCAVTVRRIKAA